MSSSSSSTSVVDSSVSMNAVCTDSAGTTAELQLLQETGVLLQLLRPPAADPMGVARLIQMVQGAKLQFSDTRRSVLQTGWMSALNAAASARQILTQIGAISANQPLVAGAAVLLMRQSAPVDSLLQFAEQLQSAAAALCAAVPSRRCCNNPGCSNLGTVSEAFALVRGKGSVCGGCMGCRTAGAGGEAPAACFAAR